MRSEKDLWILRPLSVTFMVSRPELIADALVPPAPAEALVELGAPCICARLMSPQGRIEGGPGPRRG